MKLSDNDDKISIVHAMMLICLSLDIVYFIGLNFHNGSIGRIVCRYSGYTVLPLPFIPKSYFGFVVSHCNTNPNSATLSIIFLMIKITLSFITTPFILFRLPSIRRQRESMNKTPFVGNDYGLLFVYILAISAPFLYGATIIFTYIPDAYPTSADHKIFTENVFVFTLMFSQASLFSFISVIIKIIRLEDI